MKLNEIKNGQFLTDHKEIADWLDSHEIENFVIMPDGTVHVTGGVDLSNRLSSRFPVKFGKVSGRFLCDDSKLESLVGAPYEIGGHFLCNDNKLTSLKGAPTKVLGNYVCSDNDLTTLNDVRIEHCNNFYCGGNDRLTSLIGVADVVIGMRGHFFADWHNIKSGGLGLILIKGCTGLIGPGSYKAPLVKIIEKYLNKPNEIFECQQELIDAGFEENAKV